MARPPCIHNKPRLGLHARHGRCLKIFFGGERPKARRVLSSTSTAIRSCDSLMASSVPVSPSYFLGTASSSIMSPSASSPIATDTPPAPKSLQRLMSRAASGLRNSRCSLRSSGALPFCTSAPQLSREERLWVLEEAGRPAAAVPPGTASDKQHDVAGRGLLAAHLGLRGRANHRAYFHTLCGVTGVVNLIHQPCRKAYLVAVGAVTRRGLPHDFALRQFALRGYP